MINFIEVSKNKIFRKRYLPRKLYKYLKKKRKITLVDIGAHEGLFTRAINNYCGIYSGYLIEPLPNHIISLRKKFKDPKYKIFEYVVSNQEGTIEFEVNKYDQTSSILRFRREMRELSQVQGELVNKLVCQTTTLDKLLSDELLKEIDLIKIDVQGAEHMVLEGAEKTLSKTSMIWIEVSFRELYENSAVFSDIYHDLTKRGFYLMEIESGFRGANGELLQGDTLFLKL
jgi:FkbM family methyltransferase